jgi:hypothetical protein
MRWNNGYGEVNGHKSDHKKKENDALQAFNQHLLTELGKQV